MTEHAALTDALRYAGVAAAIVGAAVAAPAGVELWLAQLRGRAVGVVQRVRARLARWLPWLKPKPQVISASGIGSTGGVGVLTLAGSVATGWNLGGPVAEQLDALRAAAERLTSELELVRAGVDNERRQRTEALEALEHALRSEVDALRATLTAQEEASAQIDARGVPLIALSVVLTGMPEELASVPVHSGWLVLAFAVIWTSVRAVRLAVERRA